MSKNWWEWSLGEREDKGKGMTEFTDNSDLRKFAIVYLYQSFFFLFFPHCWEIDSSVMLVEGSAVEIVGFDSNFNWVWFFDHSGQVSNNMREIYLKILTAVNDMDIKHSSIYVIYIHR